MALATRFSQNDLIKTTGNQYPEGICLGLVAQWLISIKNNDEPQFWKDLNGSLAKSENVPLLGMGYAKKAIQFQGEYIGQTNENPSTGEYTRNQLKTVKLTFDNAVADQKNAFAGNTLETIANRVLTNDCRYFILGVRGNGGHAIGIHRDYSLIGKSTSLHIFDPNFGKYNCEGGTNFKNDLVDIGNRYNNSLHNSFLLEGFAG